MEMKQVTSLLIKIIFFFFLYNFAMLRWSMRPDIRPKEGRETGIKEVKNNIFYSLLSSKKEMIDPTEG